MTARADYFVNHRRRLQFPWALYHREIDWRVARAVSGARAGRALVVGCGLDPEVTGVAPGHVWACDLDPDAIASCRAAMPEMSARLAVCPSAYVLPDFGVKFDAIVAKEVIEHLDDPVRWSRSLVGALASHGRLVLTTPNYGRFSTLPLIESTLLEWIARRDGYSRKHIHPSRFDRARLAALDVGPDMKLMGVERTLSGWALVGVWERVT